jgi:hypothetical protein
LFSFIVFILCSNLYIIVDFCAKSIFFYDIYVKEGREKTKKKISFWWDFFLYLSILFKPEKIYKKYNSYGSILCPYFCFYFIILFFDKKSPLSKL